MSEPQKVYKKVADWDYAMAVWLAVVWVSVKAGSKGSWWADVWGEMSVGAKVASLEEMTVVQKADG